MHNFERVEDEDPKRRPEAILFLMKAKKALTLLMKCSGAIQLSSVKEMAFSSLFIPAGHSLS